MKKTLILLLTILFSLVLVSCNKETPDTTSEDDSQKEYTQEERKEKIIEYFESDYKNLSFKTGWWHFTTFKYNTKSKDFTSGDSADDILYIFFDENKKCTRVGNYKEEYSGIKKDYIIENYDFDYYKNLFISNPLVVDKKGNIKNDKTSVYYYFYSIDNKLFVTSDDILPSWTQNE